MLLGSVGAALQWLRAQRGFPEWAFYCMAVGVTMVGCLLAMDNSPGLNWRLFILNNWPVFVTLFGATVGGTQITSSAASSVASIKPGAENHVAVPVTDSK